MCKGFEHMQYYAGRGSKTAILVERKADYRCFVALMNAIFVHLEGKDIELHMFSRILNAI